MIQIGIMSCRITLCTAQHSLLRCAKEPKKQSDGEKLGKTEKVSRLMHDLKADQSGTDSAEYQPSILVRSRLDAHHDWQI